jgi:CTP synthase (UTP-ammonia lyase)
MIQVRIVGDFNARNVTHRASTDAVHHAAAATGIEVAVDWLPTDSIHSMEDPMLRSADALLIAPGSPYRNMDGALTAISHARIHDVPLLGMCGGFQHLVVESARNVLGVHQADHAESNPDATIQVIVPLTCSLFGARMDVDVLPGTLAHRAYGTLRTTERYYCNFGLNPAYLEALVGTGLAVSGADEDGAVRILEHTALRFFVGTLFVPQTSSSPGTPHPLLLGLVQAAATGASGDREIASNEAIAGSLGR